MKDLFCIILAGGIGSRFYPLSNNNEPKQFLDFFNEKESLIQKTYKRVSKFIKDENIYVLTNKNYLKLTIKHLKKFQKKIFFVNLKKRTLQPQLHMAHLPFIKNNNAKILVCPSDHLIEENKKFQSTCINGFDYLNNNKQILTIGIKTYKSSHRLRIYKKTKKNISNKITIVEEFKEKT